MKGMFAARAWGVQFAALCALMSACQPTNDAAAPQQSGVQFNGTKVKLSEHDMRHALRARVMALRSSHPGVQDTQNVARLYDSDGNVKGEWVWNNGAWRERPSTLPASTRSLANYLNEANIAYYDTTQAHLQTHSYTIGSSNEVDTTRIASNSATQDLDHDSDDPAYGLITGTVGYDSVKNIGDLTHSTWYYDVGAIASSDYCQFPPSCSDFEYLESTGNMSEEIAAILADTTSAALRRASMQITPGMELRPSRSTEKFQQAAFHVEMRLPADSCWRERAALVGARNAVIVGSAIGILTAFVTVGGSLAIAAAEASYYAEKYGEYTGCMTHWYGVASFETGKPQAAMRRAYASYHLIRRNLNG